MVTPLERLNGNFSSRREYILCKLPCRHLQECCLGRVINVCTDFQPLKRGEFFQHWQVRNMRDIITCTLAINTRQIDKPNKQTMKEPTKQIYFYRDRFILFRNYTLHKYSSPHSMWNNHSKYCAYDSSWATVES
jgi:hypothetical protein